MNVDYGFEQDEAFLTSLGTRQDNDARWWGVAGYAAYDFTDWFRLAFRQEFFQDQNGARTGFGNRVVYWTSTLTAQFKIWKGLVGGLEYRHDAASEKVYEAKTSRPDQPQGVTAQSKSLEYDLVQPLLLLLLALRSTLLRRWALSRRAARRLSSRRALPRR